MAWTSSSRANCLFGNFSLILPPQNINDVPKGVPGRYAERTREKSGTDRGGQKVNGKDPRRRGYAGIFDLARNARSLPQSQVRWAGSFTAFIADVGWRPSPELTLERAENDKGYEPGNVRWATRKEQASNRRVRLDRIMLGGDTIEQFASKWGIPYQTVYRRLRKGSPLLRMEV